MMDGQNGIQSLSFLLFSLLSGNSVINSIVFSEDQLLLQKEMSDSNLNPVARAQAAKAVPSQTNIPIQGNRSHVEWAGCPQMAPFCRAYRNQSWCEGH